MIIIGHEIILSMIGLISNYTIVIYIGFSTTMIIINKQMQQLIVEGQKQILLPPLQWCHFEIADMKTLIGESIILCISMFVLIILVVQIKRVRHFQINRPQVYMYCLLSCWLLLLIVKTIYGIIFYEVVMVQKQFTYSASSMRLNSGIYFCIDMLTTFMLHSVLLVIFKSWFQNILNKMEPSSVEQRKIINLGFISLKIIRIYFLFRLTYLGFFILGFVMISFLQISKQASKILVISFVQSVVLMVSYLFSFYVINRLKSIIPTKDKDFRKMNLQFLSLLLCCVLRQIYLTVFFSIQPIKYSPNNNCQDQQFASSLYRCLVESIFLFLGHLLPMSIVLHIYWISQVDSPATDTESLISKRQIIQQ